MALKHKTHYTLKGLNMNKGIVIVSSILLSIFLTSCASTTAMPIDSYSSTDEDEPKSVKEILEPEKELVEETKILNNADDHYLEYLKGNEADADGEYIYEYDDEADAEYAIFDMNSDGQNELLIRIYGYFIPDIIEYKDDKIKRLYVDNGGSAGITFINSKNQYVGGDTTHVGRDLYWISEVDDQKNSHTVLFFGMEYEEYDESKEQSFYKLVNPPTDYTYEDWEKITKSEYDSLLQEYTQDNEEIPWKKLKNITSVNTSKPDDYSAEKQLGNTDDVLLDYLNGKTPDEEGNLFAISEDDKEIEYVLWDLNGDGQNELIVNRLNRWDSLWVPEVIQYNDNKIIRVLERTDYTKSFINSNNQYVDGTADVIDQESYWVRELDPDGNVKILIYFAWSEDYDTGELDYYKTENPKSKEYPLDPPCVSISESEFNSLKDKYVEKNSLLKWQQLY